MPKRNQKTKVKSPVCPYCNKPAVLKPASFLYKEKNRLGENQMVWVCSGYESGCDAYVLANAEKNNRPYGTLADAHLRNMRVRAHRAIDKMMIKRGMAKKEVYAMLAYRFGCRPGSFHLGESNEFRCQQVIDAISEWTDISSEELEKSSFPSLKAQ